MTGHARTDRNVQRARAVSSGVIVGLLVRRLKHLEAQLAPQSRVFVFFRAEEPGLPPYAEQLAAFKAKKGVCPHDILCAVTFHSDA
jgi:hypothetical protein